MDIPTSVKNARSWKQACTTRRFLDDRCRDRIGELMAEDDDQRQGEKSSQRLKSHVQRGEEMDVGVRETETSKASLLSFAELRRLGCMVIKLSSSACCSECIRKEKWKKTEKDRSK